MSAFWTFADAHPWPAVALASVAMLVVLAVMIEVRKSITDRKP